MRYVLAHKTIDFPLSSHTAMSSQYGSAHAALLRIMPFVNASTCQLQTIVKAQ